MATTKYRIVGHGPPKQSRRGDVPVEAVELVADIERLERVIDLLKRVDDWNITASATDKDREFARDMRESTVALVRSWHRYARLKLRKEYLAP